MNRAFAYLLVTLLACLYTQQACGEFSSTSNTSRDICAWGLVLEGTTLRAGTTKVTYLVYACILPAQMCFTTEIASFSRRCCAK